jgi:ABC-type cobalt transport system substrate-binding protein
MLAAIRPWIKPWIKPWKKPIFTYPRWGMGERNIADTGYIIQAWPIAWWSMIAVILWIFMIGIIRKYARLRPYGVIPSTKISRQRQKLRHTIAASMLVCMLLLPLHLKLILPRWWWIVTGASMMVLFDVSLSMLATDLTPNRFVAAKDMVAKLVKASPWSTIAITVYSAIPMSLIPFTLDHDALLNQWENFGLWVLPPTRNFVWTAIGDALIYGISELDRQQQWWQSMRPDIMLLITDGDSNAGTNPYDIIELLQEWWVPIYTVQIGRQQEILWYDQWWAPIMATIDPMVLSIIAQKTWWKSYILWTQEEMNTYIDEMSAILRQYQTLRELPRSIELQSILLGIMSILTGSIILYNTKRIIRTSLPKWMTSNRFMKS